MSSKMFKSAKHKTDRPGSPLRNWFVAYVKSFSAADSEDAYGNRLVMIGWVAAVGFPFYWWMWSKVYPQSYESLTLRLLGVGLAIPFLFARRTPYRRLIELYSWFAITYIAPFFFTFLLLMNDGASVYAQSLLIAVVALFLFESKFAISSWLVGTGLAYLAFAAVQGNLVLPSAAVMVNLPIDLFAILLVSVSKLSRRILDAERLNGMALVLATMAHELRTPLVSVHASARGLTRYVGIVMAFYEKHARLASGEEVIPASKLIATKETIERILSEVQSMNSTIDLMLANATRSKFKAQTVTQLFAGQVIQRVLAGYPYESSAQRNLVTVVMEEEFQIEANEALFGMVIINLLKNALRAIARGKKGEIKVVINGSSKKGQIIFRDTGCGIPQGQLAHIFTRFHSYPAHEGTGIGLAFCRESLASWGASISCESDFGQYSEFNILFHREFTGK